MMYEYGVYHGPIGDLIGKRAVLMESPHKSYDGGGWMAQFDIDDGAMNEHNNGGPYNYLCFGWHAFAKGEFTLYPRSTEDGN